MFLNAARSLITPYLNILKDSLWTLFLKIISVAVKFYLISVITRRYGADDYGTYVLAMSIFLLANSIIRLGFDVYIQQFTKQLLEKHSGNYIRGRFVSVAIIPFLLGLIISGIFVLIASQFDLNKTLRLTYLYELSFYTCIYSLFWLTTYFFRGLDKGKTSVLILEVIQPIINIILIYFFSWLFINVSALKILIHSFGISIIFSLLIFFISDKLSLIKAIVKFKIKDIDIKRDLINSKDFLLVSISAMILAWTDTYVIAAFEADSKIALYQVAVKFSLFTLFPVSAMSIYFMNRMIQIKQSKNDKDISHLLHSLTRVLAYITTFLVVLIMVFSREILLFFGEEFLEARTSLFVLCLAYGVAAILGLYETVILVSEKKAYLAKLFIYMAVLNICLNIPLTHFLSIEGTAVGTLLTVGFGKVMQVRFVQKQLINESAKRV